MILFDYCVWSNSSSASFSHQDLTTTYLGRKKHSTFFYCTDKYKNPTQASSLSTSRNNHNASRISATDQIFPDENIHRIMETSCSLYCMLLFWGKLGTRVKPYHRDNIWQSLDDSVLWYFILWTPNTQLLFLTQKIQIYSIYLNVKGKQQMCLNKWLHLKMPLKRGLSHSGVNDERHFSKIKFWILMRVKKYDCIILNSTYF